MDRSTTSIAAMAIFALSGAMGAQGITNSFPAVIGFVDLAGAGGIAVTPTLGDDTEHNIFTTIGNPLFPAGNVRIGNNGVAISGTTAGEISFSNQSIPTSGPPFTLPTGSGAICAYWDDLFPSGATSVMWKEDPGVLTIMWKDENHFNNQTPGLTVTFEIQVFNSPAPGAPWIQILYPDTTFFLSPIGPPFFNNGVSATIGYAAGTNPNAGNLQWSFNTASIPDGTVLSIFPDADFVIIPSSPAGPGSIRLDVVFGPPNGTYFFAVTGAAGAFPHGWFFGLDIPYGELLAQASLGFPFSGPLDTHGAMTIGPIVGLPSDLTLYTVAVAFAPGSPVPTEIAPAVSHAIP